MDKKSMTALISAFSRYYHARHNLTRIFDDSLAEKILTDEEKEKISVSMSSGIGFFNPAFEGTNEEALRWIVDNQLSPSPLGRAAWAEKSLQKAARTGAAQYLIIAAGYDTFAYRRLAWAKKLQIYEFDYPPMSEDKQRRVREISGRKPDNLFYIPIDLTVESLSEKMNSLGVYDKDKLSFCSLLGIAYYLSKESFTALLQNIAESVSNGSAIAFDYPDEFTYTEQAGVRAKKQTMMAGGAKEEMLSSYSYKEICRLLSDCGFLIYEHLTPDEITRQYFTTYNEANPNHLMSAFDNVNYCLAVRK